MWFTFFHEAAHILLHFGDNKQVFLDAPVGLQCSSEQEREADEWAANFLIPPSERQRLRYLVEPGDVQAFAEEIGVHPGIVVGRMQQEGLVDHATVLNRLKERIVILQDTA
jgi:HTH-type transcriptional regulator/antitoxin HigA